MMHRPAIDAQQEHPLQWIGLTCFCLGTAGVFLSVEIAEAMGTVFEPWSASTSGLLLVAGALLTILAQPTRRPLKGVERIKAAFLLTGALVVLIWCVGSVF